MEKKIKKKEEDEEVGRDAGFIQANGRPASFGPLQLFFFIFFLITGQILYRPEFTSRPKLSGMA